MINKWLLPAVVGGIAGVVLFIIGTPVWLGLALLGGALAFRKK